MDENAIITLASDKIEEKSYKNLSILLSVANKGDLITIDRILENLEMRVPNSLALL